MIRVERLQFSYGTHPIFRGVDLEVRRGEILTLLGPNGCGKSTFLKLLRGVLSPAEGEIRWDDQPVASFSRREMAQKAAVVAQTSSVYFAYTVRELVAMGRFPHRPLLADLTASDHKKVDEVLTTTDIEHLSERPATDLSGGELQRVMLARALAQETTTLLLDEATSHLDLIHRLTISELLVRHNREQETTIVQVSHDLDLAAEMSDRVLLFSKDGDVAALGTPGEVFTPQTIRDVFGVEVEIGHSPQTGAPRIYPIRPSSR